MRQSRWVQGLGEDLSEGSPEPESAVADGKHRGAHTPPAQVPKKRSPRLGRLAVAVGDGDELLRAVKADTGYNKNTEPLLFEANLEVDAVRPSVDVVDLKRAFSPVAGSKRRSSTRGAVISTGPATVVTLRFIA
jgi:hypothetical protein